MGSQGGASVARIHVSYGERPLGGLALPFFRASGSTDIMLGVGYVSDVFEDAKEYSLHAKKEDLDLDDVRLAIQSRVNFSFTQPPPREVRSLPFLFLDRPWLELEGSICACLSYYSDTDTDTDMRRAPLIVAVGYGCTHQ